MNELDEVWSQMLDSAMENARAAGRADVADYLALKATNDQIRAQSTGWLFDLLIEIASEANRQHPAIVIEREMPHSFTHNGANLVGSLVRARHGVRAMTLEAGWTRTPTDGFMRGGALAAARIRHFGLDRESVDLSLVILDGMPRWCFSDRGEPAPEFRSGEMLHHFSIFLGK